MSNILSKNEYELLITLVSNSKCFDIRDNTFLLSNRKMADKIKVSPSSIDRLIRKLRKSDLVRDVIPYSLTRDNYLMLSPKFLFNSYTKSDRWLIGALYDLRDILKVREWSRLCRELNCFIDCTTGEIKRFNWYDIDNKANYYTCFDRCYRKSTKIKHSTLKDENNSSYYKLDELKGNTLHNYDYDWINLINEESPFNYKPISKDSFKTISPLNINTIKLDYDGRITECIQDMIRSGLITARY